MKKYLQICLWIFTCSLLSAQSFEKPLSYGEIIKKGDKEYLCEFKPKKVQFANDDWEKVVWLFFYNDFGDLTEESIYKVFGSSFQIYLQNNYEYDKSGKLISFISMTLGDSTYNPSERESWEYSQTGQVIKYLRQEWSSGWENKSEKEFIYNDTGILIKTIKTTWWDEKIGSLNIEEYTYDIDNRLMRTEYIKESTLSGTECEIYEYRYNYGEKPVLKIYQTIKNGDWMTIDTVRIKYDNLDEYHESTRYFQENSSKLPAKSRAYYSYNDSKQPLITHGEKFVNFQWKTVSYGKHLYNENGNLVELNLKNFGFNDSLVGDNGYVMKISHLYDENQNRIKTIEKDFHDTILILEDITNSEFNDEGKLIDGCIETNFVDPDRKDKKDIDRYEYNDAGFILSHTSDFYYYDSLVYSNRESYVYDEFNNCVEAKSESNIRGFWWFGDASLIMSYNNGKNENKGRDATVIDYELGTRLIKEVNTKNEYFLGQNCPTIPDNKTMIEFAIPDPGRVFIKLFNMEGKETILFDETKSAGRYRIIVEIPSEYYGAGSFYQMECGSYISPRKSVIRF